MKKEKKKNLENSSTTDIQVFRRLRLEVWFFLTPELLERVSNLGSGERTRLQELLLGDAYRE
jgi:hypothetical protein